MSFQLSKINLVLPADILNRLVPARLFGKLNIVSKMLLGYMILVVLTVIVVVYALVNIQRINILNRSIVKGDILAQKAAEQMIEAALAQDNFEKRYLILKSDDMKALFAKRGDEFQIWLTSLKKLSDKNSLPVESIKALHDKYTELFDQEVQLVRSKKSSKAESLSNSSMNNIQQKLIEELRNASAIAKAAQDRKMKRISSIGGTAFVTTALLCVFSIIAGVLAALLITHHISSSINKLKIGTEHISEGNFDFDARIETEDEIGSLSQSFTAMGKRLRKLEEMYLDASPLTRLPGGIAIENVLKKRIDSGHPLAFCVLDLDNFKAFNDRYGYANGSEVIKKTAHIIENAVRLKGSTQDFIGHVGGDDFVVITTPDLMREIAAEIISKFDRQIPEYYDAEDRSRGYIDGKTRQGVEMHFPIMSISIAIVTNERRKLNNALEASEIAAELKDYAKTIPKSVFVVDKRRNS